jgi:DHA1 family multidrug resistance protein-like MFS transporter
LSPEPSSYHRNLFAIAAACFIGFAGFTLVMPFLPLYFAELGAHDVGDIAFWSGISLGVTPAMTALLSPLWGRVADRFGAKLMLQRSLVCFIFSMAAMAYVTRPWHIFALRALQGLFAGYGALALAMAAQSAPPGRMASAIGTVQTAQRLGPALGPIIGGVLAQAVGLRRAFLVSSIFYVIGFVLVMVLYRDEPRNERPGAESGDTRITFGSVLAFEHFLLLMAVIFAMQFVDRSLGPIFPLYLGTQGVAADRIPLLAGIVFSVIAVAAAGGHHACGIVLRDRPAAGVIAGAALTAGVAIAGFLLTARTIPLVVLSAIFGFAIGMAMTATYATAGGVIPESARATGFGFLTSASLGALALSPMTSGLLASHSFSTVFAIDAIVMAVIAAVVWRTMRPGAPPRAAVAGAPPVAPVVDEE